MRVRTKLVLVLLFVAAVMGGGVFVGFDHLREQSIDRAQANVDETASTTAAQIDETIQERTAFVARAAATPGAENFDNTEQFLEDFLRNSRFRTARIVAANGTVIDYRGEVSDSKRNAVVGSKLNAPYIDRALGGEVTVSPVSCSNTCEFTVAAPIYEGTDVTGLLTATVTIEEAGVFASLDPVETGDRTVWVTTKTSEDTVHTLDTREYEFEDPITETATVETTGWQVHVARSSASLNSLLESMLYIEVLSLLLVFGAVVTLGGWEYRTNLEQTNRLLDGFQALRDGDYEYTLSLRAAEEWRRVSEGFNELGQEIREREEQLQILNRVLRHNLRNDLSVVSGNAERVRNLTDDAEIEAAATRILDASENIQEKGDTAREIESAMASARTERESVDVSDTLDSILNDLREEYPDVVTETQIPESLEIEAPVGTDVALRQVCENAFEHNTSDDPEVTVEAARAERDDEDWFTVTVRDNGPGIPEQDREAILSGEETPLEHSSGLGLWYVHWLANRADGTLDLQENDPKGSEVTIELPVEDSD